MAVREDYELLKGALTARFSPTEHLELHKTEFKLRKRNKNQKLTDLVENIRRLATQAYPNIDESLKEELAKDQFDR